LPVPETILKKYNLVNQKRSSIYLVFLNDDLQKVGMPGIGLIIEGSLIFDLIYFLGKDELV